MIDNNGYRQNVGIIICNHQNQVLWARRYGQHSWQFPQGGINLKESPEQAMYRELFEELGLDRKYIKVLSFTKKWLHYKLPKNLIRENIKPICIGQKQRWFLLQIISNNYKINMKINKTPEFDSWRWVNYWYPIHQVIFFKRNVYKSVMKEFAPIVMSLQKYNFIK